MQKPYFSIAIPTKNRSWVLKYAIQSLLLQTFEDFEVVIADNDDGPKTRELVTGYNDNRIKYFKSGNLSMPDNWEFAISNTQGEYVLVIEDKQALKLTTLETLYNLTKTQKHGCISWTGDNFSDSHKKRNQIRFANTSGKVYKISSEAVLNTFLTRHPEEPIRCIPSGPRTAIHRDIITRVKNGPLKRVCIPVCPDLCMAYAMLHYNDYILYVDRALMMQTTSKMSNGKDFRVKGPAYERFIRESWDDIKCHYDHVPIKGITMFNSVYNDYMRVRNILGGRLLQHDLNYPNYFTLCYGDIQYAKKKNVDMSQEEDAWNRAYSEQTDHIQKDIDALINSCIKSRNNIDNYLKRQIKKLRKHIVSNKSLLKKTTNCDGIGDGWLKLFMHFDTPIDYLIWDRDNYAYNVGNCDEIIEQEI